MTTLRVYRYKYEIKDGIQVVWAGRIEVQADHFITAQEKAVKFAVAKQHASGWKSENGIRITGKLDVSFHMQSIEKDWREGVQD